MDTIYSQSVAIAEPDDNIWNENIFCGDKAESSLSNKDKLVFNIIDNLYALVYLGMNFSMKMIGYDQLVNRFCYDMSIGNDYFNKDIVGSVVCGSSSFTVFPRGMINYHKFNNVLFKLSTIALMLTKASFPIDYIDEISNRLTERGPKRLFNIIRSNGDKQTCTVTKCSSIVYTKGSGSHKSKYWKIDVNFNDHPKMTPEDIKKSEMLIMDGNEGILNKGVDLGEFMSLNDITEVTLNITKLKLDIINSFIEVDYSSDSSDGDDEKAKGILNKTYTKKVPVFIDENNNPDHELNENINYVHEVSKNYFLNRLDKYISCVKHSFQAHNIKFRII